MIKHQHVYYGSRDNCNGYGKGENNNSTMTSMTEMGIPPDHWVWRAYEKGNMGIPELEGAC